VEGVAVEDTASRRCRQQLGMLPVEDVSSGAAFGEVTYLGPGTRIYTPPGVRRWVKRVDRGVTKGSRSVGHAGNRSRGQIRVEVYCMG